jgi:hypothetical protein
VALLHLKYYFEKNRFKRFTQQVQITTKPISKNYMFQFNIKAVSYVTYFLLNAIIILKYFTDFT